MPYARMVCGAVYPRWRGEHVSPRDLLVSRNGLSPLARGTHQDRRLRSYPSRFIPAGAGNTLSVVLCCHPVTVYPRWRGEHPLQTVTAGGNHGLSPLARGTHKERLANGSNRRFIPAGAGNTSASLRICAMNAVYPRWRGEHKMRTRISFLIFGLSPLARGTLERWHPVTPLKRFIPAGAGNTLKVEHCFIILFSA